MGSSDTGTDARAPRLGCPPAARRAEESAVLRGAPGAAPGGCTTVPKIPWGTEERQFLQTAGAGRRGGVLLPQHVLELASRAVQEAVPWAQLCSQSHTAKVSSPRCSDANPLRNDKAGRDSSRTAWCPCPEDDHGPLGKPTLREVLSPSAATAIASLGKETARVSYSVTKSNKMLCNDRVTAAVSRAAWREGHVCVRCRRSCPGTAAKGTEPPCARKERPRRRLNRAKIPAGGAVPGPG